MLFPTVHYKLNVTDAMSLCTKSFPDLKPIVNFKYTCYAESKPVSQVLVKLQIVPLMPIFKVETGHLSRFLCEWTRFWLHLHTFMAETKV